MHIAVLSGKGGTGKTFVSVNLAYAKGKAVYVDCDVEEPNGRLFLKPRHCNTEQVDVMVPLVDAQKCTGCRICSEFCKFNALAYIKSKLMIFRELCHACKGCVMLCPENALVQSSRNIGIIEQGLSGDLTVITGILNTGEATGVPVIRQLFSELPAEMPAIVDCPPGSACGVMESIREADYCLLVAEPTRFGVHNLDMVYRLIKLLGKPHGLVINKDFGDRSLVEKYCSENSIPILASIAYDQQLALMNSEGRIAAAESEEYLDLFRGILAKSEEGGAG